MVKHKACALQSCLELFAGSDIFEQVYLVQEEDAAHQVVKLEGVTRVVVSGDLVAQIHLGKEAMKLSLPQKTLASTQKFLLLFETLEGC